MLKKPNDIRVTAQPIRDRKYSVAAFELLHRQGNATVAEITDDALATDQVIRLVYDDHKQGQQVLSGLIGFINVDAEMLFSTRIESLPANRVMLELLETVEVDERIICRCADLKRRGFHIALDDFCDCRDEYTPLLGLADIVKVDLPRLDDDQLDSLVKELRHFPLQLLAEKVDSSQCAQRCRELQFDLFQGYYFDPPMPTANPV